MMKQVFFLFKISTVALFACILIGCSHGRILIEGERGAADFEVHERQDEYRRGAGPRIPPGHMPPPGSCRIWYKGTPPGKQPPPGDCYYLSRRVPPGAWLIRG
ncbi:MAG: hypothetical protein JXR26_07425 [Balneolaceae bacterium]|nr:hypothetical protein [Balneolaceae bacterium]